MLANNENRLGSLLRSGRSSAEIVTQLYWVTLTRSPSADELQSAVNYLDRASNRRIATEDFCWGLLNSHEFLLRR
jgi:hypothetical protein